MGLFVLSDPPFNWCHLKLAWAREHMDTLNKNVARWLEDNPSRLVGESNADLTRHSIIFHIPNPPPLEDWSLLAADCFHNFRATLDQFIYAIAVYQLKTDPPSDARILQFPICCGPKQFTNQQGRIKSLSAPVRAAIESVQPYNRKHAELPPLLSLLRDFDDTDKHRLLQVAMIRPLEGKFEKLSGINKGQILKMVVHTGSINDGTEIAAIVFDRPTPHMHYDAFRAKLRISISHTPGPSGINYSGLEWVMDIISAEVDAVMLEIYKAL